MDCAATGFPIPGGSYSAETHEYINRHAESFPDGTAIVRSLAAGVCCSRACLIQLLCRDEPDIIDPTYDISPCRAEHERQESIRAGRAWRALRLDHRLAKDSTQCSCGYACGPETGARDRLTEHVARLGAEMGLPSELVDSDEPF